MMEAGWSTRRVALQLDHSDCIARRCWDNLIRDMSCKRRPCSEFPRQSSRREDPYIVRNAPVQPTGSMAAIQAQVALSLGATISSPFRVVPRMTKLNCSRMEPCRL
ncbi:transposable element Tcb2 transposase [Trichonephila clavipes]|nr:transposable element Tcb2 transposase [Trichonephila clavipes]